MCIRDQWNMTFFIHNWNVGNWYGQANKNLTNIRDWQNNFFFTNYINVKKLAYNLQKMPVISSSKVKNMVKQFNMLCFTIWSAYNNKFKTSWFYYLSLSFSVVYIFPMIKPLYKLQDIFFSAFWSRVEKYAPARWMRENLTKRVQGGKT